MFYLILVTKALHFVLQITRITCAKTLMSQSTCTHMHKTVKRNVHESSKHTQPPYIFGPVQKKTVGFDITKGRRNDGKGKNPSYLIRMSSESIHFTPAMIEANSLWPTLRCSYLDASVPEGLLQHCHIHPIKSRRTYYYYYLASISHGLWTWSPELRLDERQLLAWLHSPIRDA